MMPRWLAPTQRTQRLAVRMLRTARSSSGADAVAAHYDELEPEQLLALVGVLLTRAVRPVEIAPAQKRKGRPLKPLTLTPEERLYGVRRWWAGDHSDFPRLAMAEYRRARQRARRSDLQETG